VLHNKQNNKKWSERTNDLPGKPSRTAFNIVIIDSTTRLSPGNSLLVAPTTQSSTDLAFAMKDTCHDYICRV
jgi:hypothetical protein